VGATNSNPKFSVSLLNNKIDYMPWLNRNSLWSKNLLCQNLYIYHAARNFWNFYIHKCSPLIVVTCDTN